MSLDKLKQKMATLRDASEKAVSDALLKIKVSEEIQKKRFDICQACEHLYRPTNTCKKCGCLMRVKTWMPNQSCPLKKWSAVESEKSE